MTLNYEHCSVINQKKNFRVKYEKMQKDRHYAV